MDSIIAWFGANWVSVMGILWAIDQILKLVAPLTPTKIDDNIADVFGKLLAKFFKKP